MRSLAMVIGSNLKRKWGQALLIGFTLAMSALLFSLSLGMLQSLRAPYERMFERQNGAQISFFVNSELYDVDSLWTWWQTQKGVKAVEVSSCVQIGPEFPYLTPGTAPSNRHVVEAYYLVTEYDPAGKLDRLVVAKGDAKPAPGHGEVWLPTTVAMSTGAQLGDTLEIPTPNGLAALRVTAIVVDPQFSSTPNINPSRIWVGPGELSWYYSVGTSQNVMMSVRLDHDDDVSAQWQAFNQHLGGAFNGLYYSRDDLLIYFGLLFNIIATGLLVVSLISLAIAFFVIYTTIQGSIVADYRQIGVLKSLGFTPGGIILGYALQMLSLVVVFVPLGLIGGAIALQLLTDQLSQSIGLVSAQGDFGPLAALTLGGFALFVFTVSFLVARRAGKIKTVEALRLGEAPEPSVKSPFPIHPGSRSPLLLLLALKTMLTRKRRLLLAGMTVLLTTFVFAFCLNLNNFFVSEGSRAEFWGSPNTDFSISLQSKRFSVDRKVFVDDMLQDPRLSTFVGQAWLDFGVPARGKEPARVIYGVAVQGSMEDLGYWNLVGRNPTSDQEIAVGITTAKDYGLKPGDHLEGTVAGRSLDFVVTGIFQFSGNAGRGFRITEDGLRRGDPTHQPVEYYLSVQPDVDKAAFQVDLGHRYGETVKITDVAVQMSKAIRAQTDSISTVLALVFALFVVVALVMLSNTTAMEVNESRRVFGIYKSLGMTPRQIRFLMATKTVLIALVFGLVGIAIELSVHQALLEGILASFGIAKVGLNANFAQLVVVLLVFAVVCGGNAYASARAARHIPARSLVVE